MKSVKRDLLRAWNYVFTLLKWVLIAAITGAVGGLIGAAFHLSVEKVTALRESHSWLIFLLPLGGLLIAGIYKLAHLENAGTDAVIDAVRSKRSVPILLAPLIFVSTVVTHLCGG